MEMGEQALGVCVQTRCGSALVIRAQPRATSTETLAATLRPSINNHSRLDRIDTGLALEVTRRRTTAKR
jgi:hypothetical protein